MTGILTSSGRLWYREGDDWFADNNPRQLEAAAWQELGKGNHRYAERLLEDALVGPPRTRCTGGPPIGDFVGYQLDGKGYLSPGRRTGWLSPQGAFIPCASWEHDTLADILHDGGTATIEGLGWCRVATHGETWAPYHEATEAQARWLLRREEG